MSEAAFSGLLIVAGLLALAFAYGLQRLAPPRGADFVTRFQRHVPVAWLMIAFGVLSLMTLN